MNCSLAQVRNSLMTRLPTGSDGRALTSVNVVLLVTPLFCFSLVLITGKEQVSWWETWYPASHTQNWQDLISVLLVEGSISVMFGAVYVTDSSYCSVFLAVAVCVSTQEKPSYLMCIHQCLVLAKCQHDTPDGFCFGLLICPLPPFSLHWSDTNHTLTRNTPF